MSRCTVTAAFDGPEAVDWGSIEVIASTTAQHPKRARRYDPAIGAALTRGLVNDCQLQPVAVTPCQAYLSAL